MRVCIRIGWEEREERRREEKPGGGGGGGGEEEGEGEEGDDDEREEGEEDGGELRLLARPFRQKWNSSRQFVSTLGLIHLRVHFFSFWKWFSVVEKTIL